MNSKKIIYFFLSLAVIAFVFSACTEEVSSEESMEQEQRLFNIYMASNYPDAEPQPSGLYYLEHEAGTGESPGPEDWVLINHVSYLIPENQVYDTYIESVARDIRRYDAEAMYGPYKMLNGSINAGLTEGLSKMKEGGKATLMFTSELGFGSKNAGNVGAYRSLKYEIELLEVIGDMEEIEAYEQAKIDNYLDTVVQYDTVYDAVNEVVMYYIVDDTTSGAPVAIDSTIQVAYKGYLTDGRVFDQSTDDQYYQFKVGDLEDENSPIEGWQKGLVKFKDGEKGRLIIPYKMAYGEAGSNTTQGNVSIPPFETLVYDVEIMAVEVEDDEHEDPDI